AGLTPVSNGVIRLGDERLDDTSDDAFVPVEKRPISFVFQDYRLFPHLSVADNVAFALRNQRRKRGAARSEIQPWLDRLDLTDLAGRRPHSLSGGQAQR